jgi:hypothetical protein
MMMAVERNLSGVSSETTTSGVAWGSVFAGAAAAAALSLGLLVLGVGLGFSMISPWSNKGVSAGAIGAATIVWLILTQIISSGIGGYLAGRLRVKWVAVHTDEVYFRDTAHGLLSWAIASLAAAAMLGTMASNIVSGGLSATTSAATHLAEGAIAGASSGAAGNRAGNTGNEEDGTYLGYITDTLLRPGLTPSLVPAADSTAASGATGTPGMTAATGTTSNAMTSDSNAMRREVLGIMTNALRSNSLSQADQQYLAQIISTRTGLSQADAIKRVNDDFAAIQARYENAKQSAKQAADKARKTATETALWMFIALLCGAFFSSLAATFGGKRRDYIAHAGMPI